MPTYEYYCADCKRRVAIFFLSIKKAGETVPECPRCKGSKLERRVSRCAFVRSEESRLDSLADPTNFAGLDENDPKSLAKFMRKMSSEVGEPLDEELGEVCSRLESGEDPEAIEKSMGDTLGDGDSGGAGGAGGDE